MVHFLVFFSGLFVGLFFWILGLVNRGQLSVSIFSNILNLFSVSIFSVSCIFGFGVGFCLFLSVFVLKLITVFAFQ